MSTFPKNVRLQIVTDDVRLPTLSQPLPQGEYDAYIDYSASGTGEMHPSAVQLEIPSDVLETMGKPDGIPAMEREVLRYLKSQDIRYLE